jgi:hypothetical protein
MAFASTAGNCRAHEVARKSWEVDADAYASLPHGPGLPAAIDRRLPLCERDCRFLLRKSFISRIERRQLSQD